MIIDDNKLREMTIEQLIEAYAKGDGISLDSNLNLSNQLTEHNKINNLIAFTNNNVSINSLQPTTCNASMLRVFDYIKDKEINTNLESMPSTVPANTAKWYKAFDPNATSTPIGIEFVDNRDTTNEYLILIAAFNPANCPNTCGNPLRSCEDTCSNTNQSGPCLLTMTVNVSTGGITYTVPDSEIDYAMGQLGFVKSNALLYVAIAAVGLGVIYLATRKK